MCDLEGHSHLKKSKEEILTGRLGVCLEALNLFAPSECLASQNSLVLGLPLFRC